MTLFSRYLLKSLAIAMLFVTLTVTFAVWLTQSLHFLQLAVSGGAPFFTFLELVFLSLPNFVTIVLPVAFLSIILFVYNRMNAESELVVMRAAGMPPWVLARPAIWLSLFMGVVVFAMNAYIGPVANRSMKSLRSDVQNEYSTVLLRAGVFNTLGSYTIFVRDRDDNGDLLGILIEDDKDPKNPLIVVAKRGVMVETEEGPRMIVSKGERQEMDKRTGHLTRLTFDDYTIDLKFLEQSMGERWLEPSDRTLGQLLIPSGDPRDAGYEKYFFAEANARIASPLYIIDFAFIGLACLLVGEFDRRGQVRRIARAVIISLSVQALAVGFANLARKYDFAIPLLYLAGLLPILVSYLYIRRRGESLVDRPLNLRFWKTA